MTTQSLRLLMVEDSEDDATLLLREVRRGGFDVAYERVETPEAMQAALEKNSWDVITCDYIMPRFSGPAALQLFQKTGLDLPFIVVSGKVEEETAVEMLIAGAHDFILKGRLSRLVPAIRREMREAQIRQERKQAQALLEQSEARFHTVARVSPVGIFYTDARGNCLYVNDQWCELSGLTAADASGRGWQAALHPDDQERIGTRWYACSREGREFQEEYRLQRPNGDTVWVLGRGAPERSSTGAIVGWVGCITDITDLKRSAEALRQAAAELMEAQRVGHVGSWQMDCASGVLVWTAEIFRMFGLAPRASAPGYSELRALFTPESFSALSEALQRAQEEGRGYQLDLQMVKPDGSTGWMLANGEPVRDARGAIVAVRGTAMDITERKRAEQALEASESRFRALTENASDLIIVLGADGTLRYASPSLARITGYEPSEIVGRRLADVVHPDDQSRLAADIGKILEEPSATHAAELRYRHKNGSWIWLASRSKNALASPAVQGIVVNARDVTGRKQAEERIRRLNRVYAVLSGINGAIVRIRDPRELFQEASRIAVEAGGFVMAWAGRVDREANVVRAEGWAGDHVRSFLDVAPLAVLETMPGGLGLAGRAVREKKAVISNDVLNDPQRLMRKELAERGIKSLAVLPLLQGDQAVGVLSLYASEVGVFDDEEMRLLLELATDVSFALDYMEKAEKVTYLAYYDVLTGLPNRALLLDRMQQYLGHASAVDERAAFVLLDVQRFRNVNETLGRHIGDEVLKELGRRLAATVGDESSPSRIGTDVFGFVIKGVSDPREAMDLAGRMLGACFTNPVVVEGNELRLAGRMGIALFPADASDADALFRNAEAALVKAKKDGVESLFYSSEMTARVAEKLGLENRLRHAIGAQEFVLHYQPKFNARTGAVASVEALIRWNEPGGKLIPPGDFIPLLEETGLILPVGEWALREAVRQHTAWREQGIAAPRIAVNVSALQLRSKDFVSTLRKAVAAAPSDDHGLDLEITESLIMTDVEDNIEKLTAAKQMGMRIFIDDFGTGYSSLRYIAKLPLDALKIDRSFIVAMASSPEDMSIVSSIISLGRDLNLKVVAEGVESEDQAKLLRLLKCDEMQGFLFSKPLPAAEVARLLKEVAQRSPALNA